MSSELVTAIVPTYQRPQLLERSLGSVLRQTWRPLELVVVDDGSGDATQEVLAAFADKANSAGVEYRFFEKPNGGPGPAKNFGMEKARGELFAFLDDDDRWYPQKLETQLALMQTHREAGVSFTRYLHEGKEETPKPKPEQMRDGWVFETLCSGETRAHLQTLVIRRSVFENCGGFSSNRNWEDTEYELRLSLETQFLAVHEPLTVISTVENSISRQAGLQGDIVRDEEKLGILDQLIQSHSDHPRFDHAAAKVLRARIYDEYVKHLLWLGSVTEARTTWERALSECGDQPMLIKLKGKLARARVAGWFGKSLKKP